MCCRCVWSQSMKETDTYSALKPFTCNIRICLTIVLFPDSPAPESRKRTETISQTMLIKSCTLIKKHPDPPETSGWWFVAGYLNPGWRWRSRATSSVWSITDLNFGDLFLHSASTPRTLSTITNPSFHLHHPYSTEPSMMVRLRNSQAEGKVSQK